MKTSKTKKSHRKSALLVDIKKDLKEVKAIREGKI